MESLSIYGVHHLKQEDIKAITMFIKIMVGKCVVSINRDKDKWLIL